MRRYEIAKKEEEKKEKKIRFKLLNITSENVIKDKVSMLFAMRNILL